ncbi:MAG: DUF1284 domain-containing protein [Fusicatenibacter sp.]
MARQLRGHHLLCTSLFRGKGYSDGFCAGMEQIVSALHGDIDQMVCLIAEPDGICANCPKLTPEKTCSSNHNHVIHKDAAVLHTLQLEAGEELTLRELIEKAEQTITEEVFGNICGDCSWKKEGLCRYEELKQRFTELQNSGSDK